MVKNTKFTVATACLIASAMPAHAEGFETPEGWSAGLYAAHSTNPYIGEKSETGALPSLSYRKGPLTIGTIGITYDVYEGQNFGFTAGIVPRFTGLKSPKSAQLAGINRKVTGDVALGFHYDFGSDFKTELTLRQEFTGKHKGQEVVWDVGYETTIGDVAFGVSTGFSWQSKKLAAYNWGVSAAEARAGRAAYAPGDAFIPHVTIGTLVPLGDNVNLVGSVRADFLPNSVSSSPIVSKDKVYTAVLGVSYNF